jgi:hypothetical protein
MLLRRVLAAAWAFVGVVQAPAQIAVLFLRGIPEPLLWLMLTPVLVCKCASLCMCFLFYTIRSHSLALPLRILRLEGAMSAREKSENKGTMGLNSSCATWMRDCTAVLSLARELVTQTRID